MATPPLTEKVDITISVATGVVSPTGLPALLVIPGATGIQGPAGAAGPRGLIGTQGSPGVTGATGKQGVTGPIGPAGARGATGPIGSRGATGIEGDIGHVGPAGPAGARGSTGPQGIPGIGMTPALIDYVSSINFTPFTKTADALQVADACSPFGQDGILWCVDFGSQNLIYKSTDDGETWAKNANVPSTPVMENLSCITAAPTLPPGSRTPIVSGSTTSAFYVYSLDGGNSFVWNIAVDGSPRGIEGLLYHYQTGNIIAVGHTASGSWLGTISAYNLDSQFFTRRTLPSGFAGDSTTRGLSVVQDPSGRVVASWTGLSGVVYSDDGGITWNASSGISSSGNYVVTYGGPVGNPIWMAVNGDNGLNSVYSTNGTTWAALPSNPVMHSSFGRRGLACINGVFVIRQSSYADPLLLSSNNGVSWNSLYKSSSNAATPWSIYAGPEITPRRLYMFEDPAISGQSGFCARSIRHSLSVATGGFG